MEHDYDAIVSTAGASDSVADSALLAAFVDAAVAGNAATLWATRDALRQALGAAALVDTAATAAIFNAVVKIADATGIPIEDYKVDLTSELRSRLGIDDYGQAGG